MSLLLASDFDSLAVGDNFVTRGRTVTVLNGVTDPSALMRTGTSCRDAAATPTGTFWFCGRRPDALAAVCDVRVRW